MLRHSVAYIKVQSTVIFVVNLLKIKYLGAEHRNMVYRILCY